MPSNEPNRPWRSWYSEKEWYRLRAAVLRRDSVEINGQLIPKCRKTGALLTGKAPAPNSPIVDHRKPHRGDRKLFFDITNCETVSKAYHDSVKQSHERGRKVAIGADGWPTSGA